MLADLSMGGKEDNANQNWKELLAKFDQMKVRYTYSESSGWHSCLV
ncbi:hypothetical protein [Adhaeribacter radiodurans]|uniref:Uncharacterized protein n=1 Tax=Adhaeribacter radiodurans TaxID=2745197 RepID=A0A7L7L2V5_9BACT|nr:hypothetical protein [Adhaeribacter radiodurans]QMU27132.1 hypothetical protein HUW48_03395 [Adhaeribacter radiodurans]